MTTITALIVICTILFMTTLILLWNRSRLKADLKTAISETNDVKKILVGKNRKPEEIDDQYQKEEPTLIYDDMITKTREKKGKGYTYNYAINKDSIPEFKNPEEGLNFIRGFVSRPEDPSVANLTGFGPVMRTDIFIAFKLIMRYVLEESLSIKEKGNKG